MEKRALQQINYGIYIVSSKNGAKYNGQIVNSVFQVTSEPAAVAVCINKSNLTYEFISQSKVFTVSVLEKNAPMLFLGKFGFKSGRDIDKFAETKYLLGKTGAPVVTDWSLAYFECEVLSQTDAGTHAIFVGKVIAEGILQEDKEPLTYDYYRLIKKGKSPKAAPSYVANTFQTEEKKAAAKFKCKVCGYEYSHETGDAESGINAGTAFENLPQSWKCPVCKVDKNNFEKEN